MEKLFRPKNYKWNLKGLEKCIKENELKSRIVAVDKTNTKAIVHVTSYHDSVILGATSSWCISQHDCSWSQYVSSKGNTQIFVFNFVLSPMSDELSLVGATFKKDGELFCAFTRENHPLAEITKCENDSFALFDIVIYPHFGNEIDEVLSELISGKRPKGHVNDNFVEEQLVTTASPRVFDFGGYLGDYYYIYDDIF
jgi:hypothetical protein